MKYEAEQFKKDIKVATGELEKEDQALITATSKILKAGVKPVSSKVATELGREAADYINSNRKQGHTVYESHYSGIIQSNGDFEGVIFAGVGFGSGESNSALQQGAAILIRGGFKAVVVNDQHYKGVVVSIK